MQPSPNQTSEGQYNKSATDVDGQQIDEMWRWPCTPDWHWSPDVTHNSRSSKSTTNCDGQQSPNWSTTRTSRKYATNHDGQWNGEPLRRSFTPE